MAWCAAFCCENTKPQIMRPKTEMDCPQCRTALAAKPVFAAGAFSNAMVSGQKPKWYEEADPYPTLFL